MGAGSPESPVGLDPFRNIVEVSWPGRYIAFRWRVSEGWNAASQSCGAETAAPPQPFGFHYRTAVIWTIRDLAHIDENQIYETRDGGKSWMAGGSLEDYDFSGAPGTLNEGGVNRTVSTIGVADWTYIGTVGIVPSSFVFDPPARIEMIPNGSVTDVPIPDPTTAGTSHPTERFMDATNLIVERDIVRFTGGDHCRVWPQNDGGDGTLHTCRALESGASRAEDLDGQFDCSAVEAIRDGRRYIAHGFYPIAGDTANDTEDFWFLLKHVGPA